jgi:multidrug resistance efflux pump
MMGKPAMRAHGLLALSGWFLLAATSTTLAASTAADFEAALGSAETAEKEAGVLKNQWTTTEDVLTTARAAAAAGDFDTAVSDAKRAEALAKASIAQAKEQQEAWRAGIIH